MGTTKGDGGHLKLCRAEAAVPVDGIASDTMQPWRDAGAAGFGLGPALKPDLTAIEAGERTAAFIVAIRTSPRRRFDLQ